MPPRLLLALLFALGLGLPAGLGAAGPRLLQAGPMIGHVDDTAARVWLRAKAATAVVAVAVQGEAGARLPAARLEALGDGFLIAHFDDLVPATAMAVEIVLTRAGSDEERAEVRFRTAPPPSAKGLVRIAFGSCSKLSLYKTAPVYRAIAEEGPDFACFVGDNCYFIVGDGTLLHYRTSGASGDWTSPEAMMARHLFTRTHPDLQPLLRSVPSYAVWDDHDYGPNNAGADFDLKEEALGAFRKVWANPGYGTAATPGVFSSFRHGPVEVFLMDDRYYKVSPQRDPGRSAETGEIWGRAQLEWLLAGLAASTAPVKVVANGTQVLSADPKGEGHGQEARGERARLLEFLDRERIGGVVFLTGDRHYSEAMELALPGGALLVEATSSPLQQGQKTAPLDRPHRTQLWAMEGNGYGLVTVDVRGGGRGSVRFEARDEANRPVEIDGLPRATTWSLARLYPQAPGR